MNICFAVFCFAFLVIAVTCNPINDCLPFDNQPEKCGANACVVRVPRSQRSCAPSCDYKEFGGIFPRCTNVPVFPGCDPLPGFFFKKGQSGDAVRFEDC